jgi:hypothetical protein
MTVETETRSLDELDDVKVANVFESPRTLRLELGEGE